MLQVPQDIAVFVQQKIKIMLIYNEIFSKKKCWN